MNQAHHKSDDANAGRFFLVRWYYKYYYFFGYCCVGAEFTYVTLYMMAHHSHPWLSHALHVLVPACATKQLVNIVQLTSACHAVASHDAELKNK
jgi:CDP-diacylglycerol--inositol 3-phosphatidyltransferase